MIAPRRIPYRPRGFYVPSQEAPIYLANGWRLLDDCPGCDRVLLQPPRHFQDDVKDRPPA
jgi:hypothetical protein